MLNSIPILGWLLSLLFAASKAVPFWIIWTLCGIGKTYFYFLPPVFQEIPFWNAVGLFIVLSIVLPAITPKFVSVSSSAENKTKD